MIFRVVLILIALMFSGTVAGVELLGHTSQSGGKILRLLR